VNLREEFEKEYMDTTKWAERFDLKMNSDGKYIMVPIQVIWEFYQAGFKLGADGIYVKNGN